MESIKRDRIENTVDEIVVEKFKYIVNRIADVMLEDGFEYSDVKEFLQEHLDEILGE